MIRREIRTPTIFANAARVESAAENIQSRYTHLQYNTSA